MVGAGMARAALAALALAVCAYAEQYGGAMPHYGAGDYVGDYHAHSPDAPAPLDYKYQEEPHEDRLQSVDKDHWRKSGRIQRRPSVEDTEEEVELENKALEAEARSGRRRRNRRGRGRRDESRHEQPAAPRRRPPLDPASRPARIDSRHKHYLDSIDYRDDRNKYHEDNDLFPFRETTAKIIGRKPRQKLGNYVPDPPIPTRSAPPTRNNEDFLTEEEDEKVTRPIKDEFNDDKDYLGSEEPVQFDSVSHNRRTMDRAQPPITDADNDLRSGLEGDENMRGWRHPKPAKNYPDYNDFPDLKNIQNIQQNLPTLLRRPTPTTSSQRPTRRFSPGRLRPWPERRAGELGVIPLKDLSEPTPTTTQPSTESTIERVAFVESIESTSGPPTKIVTEFYLPVSPLRTSSISIPTPTTTRTMVAILNETTPALIASVVNGSELSMADKSRLSILKKAQMKESAGKGATRKPPVLLHVTTQQFPTVVMVAPGTADPWHGARLVSGDSPATLEKVKRLMRQKLVSGAKSIRDLTDNWDDTVCDYIDVGFLDSLPNKTPCAPAALQLFPMLSFCFIVF